MSNDQQTLKADDNPPSSPLDDNPAGAGPVQLLLPRDAFVAFRQSGGFRFNTREVIVYRDGRVTWRREGKFEAGQGERQLTSEESADLRDMIEQSGFFELPTPIGRPTPDGYAYELSAQAADRAAAIEFFSGSIPANVQALVTRLQQWSSDENR